MMRSAMLIFIIWRSLLFTVAGLSAFFITQRPLFTGYQFHIPSGISLWPWANFDGEHYLWIARFGYREFEYAFFPGYPLLVKIIASITNDVLSAGLLVSNVCAFFLIAMLYKLFSLDFSRESVLRGIILFLCFPSAFYLGSVYSESLFLLLVVLSFYFARKEQFFLSGLMGMWASFTRLVGVLLIPSLAYIVARSKRRFIARLMIGLSILGLIGVMVFNYYSTGDYLNFATVQSSFGANRSGDKIILPVQVIYRYIKIFTSVDFGSYLYIIAATEFLFTLLFLGLLILLYKQMKKEYWVFCLGVLILPILSGTLSSMPRYSLAAFPIMFYIADRVKGVKFLVLSSLLFCFQIIGVVLFVNGYFVA